MNIQGHLVLLQGAWYIQEVLNALTENSQVWSQTVLLVNFDENDGFFDHVPSPSAPSKDINGVVYGKTTLTDQQVSYEYFNHPAVATQNLNPKQTDGCMAAVYAFQCM